MNTLDTLGKRIAYVMDLKGISRQLMAEKLATSTMAIGNIINDKVLKPRNLTEIAELLGVDYKWLRDGGNFEDSVMADPSAIQSELQGDLVSSEFGALHKHRIDYYDVRAAAGLTGFENSDYPEIISSLYLTDEGMAQLVGKKSSDGICLVNVPTDSMEPTIRKGDIVFLDTKVNAYSGDGIYAFAIDGALFIKRIQKMIGGGYRMISDNEIYPPEQISDDVCENAQFIGRFIRTIHIEAVNL